MVDSGGNACESEIPGSLEGHRRQRIYGRLDCSAAIRAIERGGYVRYRVFFLDETTARAAGYRPCGVCMAKEYRAWKTAPMPRKRARLASQSRAIARCASFSRST